MLKMRGKLFYLHCAPPYSTAKRARGRKRARRVRRQRVHKTRPLRNAKYPHGFPQLRGIDLLRVTIVNSIYRNVAKLCRLALENGAFISVENPSESWMWSTRWFQSLCSDFQLQAVKFQHCAHGGQRPKWSTFLTNAEWLRGLSAVCPQDHVHKSWSEYRCNTKLEAEYPLLLCSRIADAAFQHAVSLGCQPIEPPAKRQKSSSTPRVMAQAGRQPRGNKYPELISEFRETLEVPWPWPKPSQIPRMLSASEAEHLHLTQPTKLLSCMSVGSTRHESGHEPAFLAAKLGVFRSPDEFVDLACNLQHPFDNSSGVSDDLKRNLFFLLTAGPAAVQDKRDQVLGHYRRRKQELESHELSIHEALQPHRERVVAGKNFLLFDEMCKDAGVVDHGLLDLMVSGAPLIGESGVSNLFELEDNLPAMSPAQLMKSSRWSRRMLAGRCSNSQTDEVGRAVWQVTMDEVSKGWLEGPLSEAQVTSRLGPLFVASPRFGLVQSDKIRPIDDMSVSLVNSAFAARYKLDLDGVDSISVLCRTAVEAVQADRQVVLELEDGSQLRGVLHESLSVSQARSLHGRTLDLEAAYKQMLVRASSLWTSVLLVPDGRGGKGYFISQVLPFGASASVFAFNRVARAIHCIGVRLFGLMWLNYYDDFPQVDLCCAADAAMVTAEGLLDLLGWKFSQKESKRAPMATKFSALGVDFDLSSSAEGMVLVANKPSKVQQIVSLLNDILETGHFPPTVATSLRGRLQFAESQTFGRAVALHMRSCQQRATGAMGGAELDQSMREELLWAKNFVQLSPPRVLKTHIRQNRVLIFTDAALEDDDQNAGVGMVAFVWRSGQLKHRFFFAESVPADVLRDLQVKTPKVIAALELLAAVMAVELLQEWMTNSRTFIFIDNEAARANLISMYSPVKVQAKLLQRLHDIMMHGSMFVWTCRVPSVSNVADAPSRQEFKQLLCTGFVRLTPSWHR